MKFCLLVIVMQKTASQFLCNSPVINIKMLSIAKPPPIRQGSLVVRAVDSYPEGCEFKPPS